jgi:hypothetical protein
MELVLKDRQVGGGHQSRGQSIVDGSEETRGKDGYSKSVMLEDYTISICCVVDPNAPTFLKSNSLGGQRRVQRAPSLSFAIFLCNLACLGRDYGIAGIRISHFDTLEKLQEISTTSQKCVAHHIAGSRQMCRQCKVSHYSSSSSSRGFGRAHQ